MAAKQVTLGPCTNAAFTSLFSVVKVVVHQRDFLASKVVYESTPGAYAAIVAWGKARLVLVGAETDPILIRSEVMKQILFGVVGSAVLTDLFDHVEVLLHERGVDYNRVVFEGDELDILLWAEAHKVVIESMTSPDEVEGGLNGVAYA